MNHSENIITSAQLTRLLITLVTATAILFLPAISLQKAGNGGWLSPGVDALVGLAVVSMMYVLGNQFPGKTIIEYLPCLIGIHIGKMLGLLYSVFFLSSGMLVIRELDSFLQSTVLPRTPTLAIDIAIYSTLAYALYCGFESIARVNDLFFVFIFFLLIALVFGLLGEFHGNAFLPILDKEWSGVIAGAFVPASWFAELDIIGFLLPFTGKGKIKLRSLQMCVIPITIILMGVNAITISVVGAKEGARLAFPTYEIIKYIQHGELLQHLDIIFLIPWIFAMFIKAMLFYYVGILGLKQIFNISRYQVLTPPLLLMSIACSVWMFPGKVYVTEYLSVIFPHYTLALALIIPFILILVHFVRHKLLTWRTGL